MSATSHQHTSIDLDLVARDAAELPALPASVSELARLVGDPEIDLRRVAEVIALDPALVASLLRHTNSAFVSGRRPVTTPLEAVTRLGTSTVVALATGIGLASRLRRPVPAYGLVADELWAHAGAAFAAADVVAERTWFTLPPQLPTAALLHDIGKLVLCQHLSPNVVEAMATLTDGGDELWRVELDVLGTHHGEVGGFVLESWGLPLSLVEMVAHHHTPDAVAGPGAHAVAVCNHLADELHPRGVDVAVDGRPALGPPPASLAALRIDPVTWPELVAASAQRFRLVSKALDLA